MYCFTSSVLNYFCFISLKTQGDLEGTSGLRGGERGGILELVKVGELRDRGTAGRGGARSAEGGAHKVDAEKRLDDSVIWSLLQPLLLAVTLL